jgi:hypothetical protein
MKLGPMNMIEGDAYCHVELLQSPQNVIRDSDKFIVFAMIMYFQSLKLVLKSTDFSLELLDCSVHDDSTSEIVASFRRKELEGGASVYIPYVIEYILSQ